MIDLKSNDNHMHQNAQGHIVLPLPPENISADVEMEIYARFMRHLRVVPNKRVEVRILSAIQFTADLLIQSDEYVAKVLVDLGLRAPKQSFPTSYTQFIESSYSNNQWGTETISPVHDLKEYWSWTKGDAPTNTAHSFRVPTEKDYQQTQSTS